MIKKKGEIPNLLFYGSPGVGKTTVAHIIGRTIFGENYKSNFYDMNASSDRGIDVIRGLVQQRAKARTVGSDKPKIIFLDEVEALTRDAQTAMRRVMEDYYETCRFILSTNYLEKIIPPIRDRCAQFHFEDLAERDIAVYLWKRVNPNLEKRIAKDQVKRIAKKANGSLRRALNLVESGYNKDVESDKELLKMTFAAFQSFVYKNASDPDLILNQLHREVLTLKNPKMLIHVAEADYRMSLGTNRLLQLLACFAKIKQSTK